VQKVESRTKHATPGKRVRKVLRVLNKKDKEEIVQAALEKYYNSEELKPYQAELIKMQRHLEKIKKKWSSFSTAGMPPAKAEPSDG